MTRNLTEIANAERDFPRVSGTIINPRYLPQHQQANYLAQIGLWCRTHERKTWRPWIVELVAEHQNKISQVSKRDA